MSSRLECRNLTKDYGNVMALSDVNLTLESGRIVGLLGPNGSGKTTLIKLANGLLQPTSGEILLNGLKPGPETKAFVSYLPDANYLPDWMNVEALVGMFDDFVFLDPPYDCIFSDYGNIQYQDGFNEENHRRFAEQYRRSHRRIVPAWCSSGK